MRLSLGYPSEEFERRLLLGDNLKTDIQPVFEASEVAAMVESVKDVHASEAVVQYLQTLLARTRTSGMFVNGLSPRAGLQWLQAAKALAFVEGRSSVLPDDIKSLATVTAAHRLHCNDGSDSADALRQIVDDVEVL